MVYFREAVIAACLLCSCLNTVQVAAFVPPSATPLKHNKRPLIKSFAAARGSQEGGGSNVINKKSRVTKKKQTKKKKPFKKKDGARSQELAQAKAVNKELMEATSAQDILSIFSSKGGAKGIAGGGAFNSVNYSTLLHRLARFANYVDYTERRNNNNRGGQNQRKGPSTDEKRKIILSDPRTAILLSSLAEALVAPKSNTALVFNNRELANLGWALAKLKISPPSRIYPITRPGDLIDNLQEDRAMNEGPEVIRSSIQDMEDDTYATAAKVRELVLEVAKERSTMKTAAERAAVQSKWIPSLSQLSGKLLDVIATQALEILDDFNTQELANLLYAFASAGRADHVLFEALSEQLVKNMKEKATKKNLDPRKKPKPQEFSNSVWAFASSGLRCQGQINLIQTVADTLDRNEGEIVRDFKPQELSNTAWATATLLSKRGSEASSSDATEDDAALRIYRWVAQELGDRVDMFKPQEVSNSVWAFATVGFGASASSVQMNTNNEYICLPSDQADDDRELVTRTLDIVADSAIQRLHRFRPQELNNLAWGFCRLGHNGPKMDKLFEGIGKELMRRHYYFKPQDIGTTLWSFATVEYFNDAVYEAAASELTLRKSHSFKPQELSNTIWSLATAGMDVKYSNAFDTTLLPKSKRASFSQVTNDPVSECFAAATTELMRRPQQFKAQEMKDVLWSLSRAEVRHPGVFKRVAEHLVGSDEDAANGKKGRGMSGFSPQGLGNLAWSYAKQAQLGADVNGSKVGSTGRLAVYETSCLDIGESLIQRLFAGIAEGAMSGLHRYKPQDLSNTCWAFATLGLLHTDFFDRVSNEVRERLSSSTNLNSNFKAQEMANLVWSFATLNHPSGGMLHSFTPYAVQMCKGKGKRTYDESSISKFFKRQEVANMAWSCAVLEEYPKELMPLIYTALFGKNQSGNPDELKRLYDDDGIQKQTVMTMFYVQMALDMEAPDLSLTLPDNFPQGWKCDSNGSPTQRRSNSHKVDTSMLQLTTSRLQQDISDLFMDIGFDHVLEHVISTDELEQDYGVSLSSENQEFLSLDIANLEQKIGIEVDGPGHFVNVINGEKDVNYEGGALKTSRGAMGWEFTANSQQQVNGPTALKHRLMEHLGWSVGHIPYFEWRDQEDVEDYCRQLIAKL